MIPEPPLHISNISEEACYMTDDGSTLPECTYVRWGELLSHLMVFMLWVKPLMAPIPPPPQLYPCSRLQSPPNPISDLVLPLSFGRPPFLSGSGLHLCREERGHLHFFQLDKLFWQHSLIPQNSTKSIFYEDFVQR